MNKDIKSIEKKDCTGCGACKNLCPVGAIEMVENDEGFLYPHINEDKCVHCGLCFNRCPAVNQVYDNNPSPDCYAVMGDDKLRQESSSGGMFSIVAEYVLSKNGYVCGAVYGDNLTTVKHVLISNKNQLAALRKSKYIQSDTGFVFKQIKEKLDGGNLVFFVGTPCQVAGIKCFLGKPYENLLTADIICHGAPSHLVFEKFLEELPNKGKIVEVNFREKKIYGWSPTMLVKYEDGTEYYKPKWECDYYKAFLSIMACRKCCGDCKFNKLPRQGDFTFGDFWGIADKHPELDDHKGTSLVLINNKKAEKYFAQIKKQIPVCKKADIEIGRRCNGNIFGSSHEHRDRDRFMKLLKTHSLTDALRRVEKRWFDVGIVGWWYGKNYGSALTYFAIHEVVESLGYDTLMLEWPFKNKPFPKTPDNNVRRLAKKYYNYSAQYTFDEYPLLNNHCEQFLVGSDQLWNWWCSKDMGNYYMLDFVRDNKKKISYSTSFGHPHYDAPESVIKQQSKILKNFDAISVREDDGVTICNDVFGVKATQTFDPVFLCDKSRFEELIKNAKIEFDKPYMLAYILSPNKEKGEVLKQTAEKLGLDLIIILDGQTDLEENKKLLGIENVRTNVGIEEWLAYIYNSSHMVTDSFHGVCFSIIFEKQFTCILNKARGISRFNTLLGHLNLFDLAVDDPINILTSGVLEHKADYKKVNKILKSEVDRSREWLKNALAMKKQPPNSLSLTPVEEEKPAEINASNDDMNVMLMITDDFTHISMPFIYSLIKNNKWAKNIHLYILTNALSKANRAALSEFITANGAVATFIDVDVSIFNGLKVSEQYPLLLYCKLLPHKFLPENLNRAIYFDVDMVVDGSLEELYNLNLEGKYLAGAYDIGPFRRKVEDNTPKTGLDYTYINSGTLLINLEKFRNDNINIEFYKEILKTKTQALYEEWFMNNCLEGKILNFFPFDYNYNPGQRHRYNEYESKYNVKQRKAIIHYMPFMNDSPILKPWDAYEYFYEDKFNNLFNKELYDLYNVWWKYALMLPAATISTIIAQSKVKNQNQEFQKTVLERDKWQVYSNTFKHILAQNLNHANVLAKKFIKMGIKNLAFYGNTEITKVLISLLQNNKKINISYIVDNKNVDGIKTLPRDAKEFPVCDLMLVCDVAFYGKIADKLEKMKVPFKFENAAKFLQNLHK